MMSSDFFRYRAAEIGRLIPFMVERVEKEL
jgi:hypothetical protein